MQLFPFLQLLDPALKPPITKIHLATPGGEKDPLDEFVEGTFPEFQSCQSRRNFERSMVLALIGLPEPGTYLFAGLYDSHGCMPCGDVLQYNLRERPQTTDLVGRLVVAFRRSGRTSYLNAESCHDRLVVAALRSERHSIGDFPGFTKVLVRRDILRRVVEQQLPSWRSALSSVAGVYLITDRHTGKLYVGSATGVGGFWTRWCQYVESGHGGNRRLVEHLSTHGSEITAHFQFSILETADTRTSADEIKRREQHWKDVLMTREHGHNAN